MNKVKVGIVGPGNIGLDLLYKLLRSDILQPEMIVNIFPSKGLELAAGLGVKTSPDGIQDILDQDDIRIVFDCTSASAHLEHAPRIKAAGKFAVDLTPAAVGPYLVPAVSLQDDLLSLGNVNMVTCGGQATIPVVAAIHEAAGVDYAEIVASISSKSAGPGTRANIDEFIHTTETALKELGGAKEAKVILILNPAEPPIFMRNTIYTKVRRPDLPAITRAVDDMVARIRDYVPGYQVLMHPMLKDDIVTTMIQVEGLGDYLPVYSGNLDIINAAAIRTAESVARQLLGGANG